MNTLEIVVLLSVLALFTVALTVTMRRLMQQKASVSRLQAEIDDLHRQLTMYVDGSIGLGKRLIRAEQQLRGLSKEHAALISRQSNLTYLEASQLLRQGAGVEQLMKQCGVSQTEANLMALLHKDGVRDKQGRRGEIEREKAAMEASFAAVEA